MSLPACIKGSGRGPDNKGSGSGPVAVRMAAGDSDGSGPVAVRIAAVSISGVTEHVDPFGVSARAVFRSLNQAPAHTHTQHACCVLRYPHDNARMLHACCSMLHAYCSMQHAVCMTRFEQGGSEVYRPAVGRAFGTRQTVVDAPRPGPVGPGPVGPGPEGRCGPRAACRPGSGRGALRAHALLESSAALAATEQAAPAPR